MMGLFSFSLLFFLKERDLETQPHREGGSVTMEAETGVMHLQANECQGLPTTTRSKEEARKDSSQSP